jgi:GT2 family glycosyltransferase/glycosyltransferase involved in cell wall biosynthesis
MHRAGTSALARVLSLRGAQLPARVLPANAGNASGYWEPERIVGLNDRILAHYGASWDDPFAAQRLPTVDEFPQAFLAEATRVVVDEYADASLLLIKDPRCTLLLPFWERVLASMGIATCSVAIMRPWQEVAASLVRRDGTSAVGAALSYVAHGLALARHMRAGGPCLTYAALMRDWRAETDRVAAACGFDWPRTDAGVDVDVETFLRRSGTTDPEVVVPRPVGDWADAAWSWFQAVASGRPATHGGIDRIEQQLGNLMPLLGPLLEDRQGRFHAVERALTGERDQLLALYRETDARLTHERDEALVLYRQTDGLLQQTQSDYRRLEGEHAHLVAVHADTSRELAAVYASRSWRLTGPLRRGSRAARTLLRGDQNVAPHAAVSLLPATTQAASTPARSGRRLEAIPVPAPGLRAYLDAEFGPPEAEKVLRRIVDYRLPVHGQEVRGASSSECSLEEAQAWVARIATQAQQRVPPGQRPDVSIVLPVYNELPFTLACIEALVSHSTRYSFEVIVGDDASTDHTAAAFAVSIAGVRHVRHAHNLGFVRNCNAAARDAQGRYVMFLNNDTQVLPGWMDELIGTLEADPGIGLAGSKLVYPDGRLQECGAIVWRDGSAWNYGRLADPRRPEFCYLRDVDYVSGASIALRRDLWQELGGFDELFVPAYAEDADLAFRVRDRGLRTVVQPLSQLLHFEGISSGTDLGAGAKAYQVENLRKLHARWAHVLERHRANADQPELEKERAVVRRALFIDHCTPTPREDAGSVVAFEVMKGFVANGYKVTFIPEDNFAHVGSATHDLQRIGIEAIYHPAYSRMSAFLSARNDSFDVIFLHRFGVGDAHLDALRRKFSSARVLFLNADMHHLRELRQAELNGDAAEMAQAHRTMRRELQVVAKADVTLVHSDYEQALLQQKLPNARVALFPLIHEPVEQVVPLAGRGGVCFVGGFRHPPNADGICWFVDHAWPLVLAEAPEAELHIVGSHVTAEVQALSNRPGVRVVGFVDDLEGFLAQRRVSVAPLRYGAGAKGKVAGSLAQGVPVVCTPVAAEGMQLSPGHDVLVGTAPDELARHVLRLLRDDAAWHRLSDAGLAYARAVTSRAHASARLRDLLAG